MRDLEKTPMTLGGCLLVAHPSLSDPNFRRTVVLLSEHSLDQGALGVVLNRPLGKTLDQVSSAFEDSILGAVPAFEGGPVAPEQVLFVAWRWRPEEGNFELFFGVAAELVKKLRAQDPEIEVRAFLGYSGWGAGQLETELEENAWLLSPLQEEEMILERLEPLWRTILHRLTPELGFLADAPDDPRLN